MYDIEAIAEPLRQAVVAYYATNFASPRRLAMAHHVFGFEGALLVPQLDELARGVRHENTDARSK